MSSGGSCVFESSRTADPPLDSSSIVRSTRPGTNRAPMHPGTPARTRVARRPAAIRAARPRPSGASRLGRVFTVRCILTELRTWQLPHSSSEVWKRRVHQVGAGRPVSAREARYLWPHSCENVSACDQPAGWRESVEPIMRTAPPGPRWVEWLGDVPPEPGPRRAGVTPVRNSQPVHGPAARATRSKAV